MFPAGEATFEAAFGTDQENALEWPVWFGEVPGKVGNYVAIERGNGKTDASIWAFVPQGGKYVRKIFLTLPVKTTPTAKDERGLLSMAFHPDFVKNRKYYVYYVPKEPLEKTTDSIFIDERVADTSLLSDAGTPARRILAIPTPYWNHKGSTLVFGPDGYLYIGFGDGGDGGDPHGNGQNLNTLLAKILRIDVNTRKAPYAIPADNPFASGKAPDGRVARREIWAYGIRNPWRSSFDPVTKELWVGDVGQDHFDEIDVITKGGGNYGWNRMEGFACFKPGSDSCDKTGITLPVASLTREESVALTGGFVYRGDPSSPFYGSYVFADFETKNFFALRRGHQPGDRPVKLAVMPDKPASFGVDSKGELYFVGYTKGRIYKINLPAGRVAQGG